MALENEANLMNKAWLRCEVHPGMFDDESAIGVTTDDGMVVSFFLSNHLVKNDEIAVGVVARNGDYAVVTLPERTFEGSNAARVRMGDLRFA